MFSHTLPYLKHLTESSADIEASVLVSIDGLIMESTLPEKTRTEWNTDCFGAICAGAVLLGQHASERLDSGGLEQVLIKCTQNHILMTYAGDEAILAVITKHAANLEMIFLEIKRVADTLTLIVNPNTIADLNKTSYRLAEQKRLVPKDLCLACNTEYTE